MKSIIKYLFPPFILEYANRILGTANTYKGDYQSWKQALENSSGYDKNNIIEKVYQSALKVKNNEAIFERDSILFFKENYNWPLITACHIAKECEKELIIIDFGGSLGSAYFQNRKMLEKCKPFKWKIVEQEKFVAIGKKKFEDGFLEFYKSMSSIKLADIVILSSVLQYLESPYDVMDKITKISPKIIFIDRTPFIDADSDLLTVQHVSKSIYGASYPAWFFSDSIFRETLLKLNYIILAEYITMDKSNVKAKFKSYILERNNDLA